MNFFKILIILTLFFSAIQNSFADSHDKKNIVDQAKNLADKAKEQYDQDIQTWKTNKNSKQYDFIPNEKKSGPVSMKTSKLSKALTANLNNNEEPGLRV